MLHLLIAAATAATAVVTPAAAPDYACQVEYTIRTEWQAFQSNIVITNIGEKTLYGWTLLFPLPAGQKLTEGWNAKWKETATGLQADNESWNGEVAKGQSANPVFRGTGTDLTSEPKVFTVNNIPCSVV